MLFYRLNPFGQVILYVILRVKPLRAGYTVCYFTVSPFGRVILYVILQL